MALQGREGRSYVALVILGMSCYFAWMAMGISPTLFQDNATAFLYWIDGFEFYGRLLGIVPVALLAMLAIKFRGTVPRFAIAVIGVCVSILSAVVSCMSPKAASDQATIVLSVSVVAISYVIMILWVVRLCSLAERSAVLCILLSHIVGFGSVLALALLPSQLQITAFVTLPAFSCIALYSLAQNMDEDPKRSPYSPSGETKDASLKEQRGLAKKLPWRVLLGVGAYAVATQFLFMSSEEKMTSSTEWIWIVSGVFFCVVLLVISLVWKRFRVISLAKVMLPVFVVAEFLIFASSFDQSVMEVFCMGCAWMLFRVFYWVAWRLAALKSAFSQVLVVAAGFILFALGGLAGVLASKGIALLNVPSFVTLALSCLMAIVSSICFFDSTYIARLGGVSPRTLDPEDEAMCLSWAETAAERYGFSVQEKIIAAKLIAGKDNPEIRKDLVITANTLYTHLRNMYKKAEVHSREGLIKALKESGDNGLWE